MTNRNKKENFEKHESSNDADSDTQDMKQVGI